MLWWGDEPEQNIITCWSIRYWPCRSYDFISLFLCRNCFHQRVLESTCSYRCENLIPVTTRTMYHIRSALPADPGKLCSDLRLILDKNLRALSWRSFSHLCPPMTTLPGPIWSSTLPAYKNIINLIFDGISLEFIVYSTELKYYWVDSELGGVYHHK